MRLGTRGSCKVWKGSVKECRRLQSSKDKPLPIPCLKSNKADPGPPPSRRAREHIYVGKRCSVCGGAWLWSTR